MLLKIYLQTCLSQNTSRRWFLLTRKFYPVLFREGGIDMNKMLQNNFLHKITYYYYDFMEDIKMSWNHKKIQTFVFLSNKFWLSVLSVLWLYDCSPLYQSITDCHDITEILLKVALNTIKPDHFYDTFMWWKWKKQIDVYYVIRISKFVKSRLKLDKQLRQERMISPSSTFIQYL